MKSQWTTTFYCYPYLFYFSIYFFLVTCFRGLHAARRFFVVEEKVHRFTSSLSSPPITPSYLAAPILHRNMFQTSPRHEYSLHGRAVPIGHHPSIFIHYFSSYTFFPSYSLAWIPIRSYCCVYQYTAMTMEREKLVVILR